jgi:hypothetical protein
MVLHSSHISHLLLYAYATTNRPQKVKAICSISRSPFCGSGKLHISHNYLGSRTYASHPNQAHLYVHFFPTALIHTHVDLNSLTFCHTSRLTAIPYLLVGACVNGPV